MSKPAWLPTPPQISAELVAVLLGTLGAAFIISRFPKVREFVSGSTIVIRDTNGTQIL